MQINGTTLTIAVAVCSIIAFFIGQYAGIKKSGYEQGVRDAKIEELTKKVDELLAEFKDWNMGALVQRIIALEKVVFKRGES